MGTFILPVYCSDDGSNLQMYMNNIYSYTDHAGLEIPVNSRIASPFSRQIANDNAGPTSALDSMGPKPTFRCHFLNIGPSYKQ